jgi:hypothetical protein
MADLKVAGLVPHDAVDAPPVPADYTAKQEAYNQAALKGFADPSHTRMDGPYGLAESPGWRIVAAQHFGVERPKHRLSQALGHYPEQRTTKDNRGIYRSKAYW